MLEQVDLAATIAKKGNKEIHPTRGVEAESAGRASRPLSDRILQFEAYEREKQREGVDLMREGRHRDVLDVVPAAAADAVPKEAPPRKKLFSEIPHIEGEHIVLDRVVDADAAALRDLICPDTHLVSVWPGERLV